MNIFTFLQCSKAELWTCLLHVLKCVLHITKCPKRDHIHKLCLCLKCNTCFPKLCIHFTKSAKHDNIMSCVYGCKKNKTAYS